MTTTPDFAPEFTDQAAEHWAFEATADRTLGDAHRSWHIVNGWDSGCPLDCAEAYGPDPVEIAEVTWTEAGATRSLPIYDGDDVATEARRIARTYGVTVTVRR